MGVFERSQTNLVANGNREHFAFVISDKYPMDREIKRGSFDARLPLCLIHGAV